MPLHPEIQELLKQIEAVGLPPFSVITPQEARQRSARSAASLGSIRPPGVRIHDEELPGPGGPLRLRVFTPEGLAGPLPGLVFFHGGGWVVGSVENSEAECSRLALGAAAVVLSVEYRLAPEHRFPAAVEDAVAAFRWVREHAERLGLVPERIGIGGESAGGNLAAVTCLELRGTDAAPCMQLLIYPSTDSATDYAEKREVIPGLITPSDLKWFTDHYLRSDADRSDPRVSPNLAPELSGLPHAIIAVAGFDPLYAEGMAYAARLQIAGVPLEILGFPDLIHAFISFAAVLPSCALAEEQIHARARAVLHGPAPAATSLPASDAAGGAADDAFAVSR